MIKAGLNYRIRKLLKKDKIHRKSISYEKANEILIFFTAEGNEKFQSIKEFSDRFIVDHKKVAFLYLLMHHEDRPDVGLDDRMKALDKKDINIIGEIKDDEVNTMLSTKYDYLIHADTNKNTYTDLVMAYSKANCRVGKLEAEKEDFYDLLISTKNGHKLRFLLDQFYHYLKFMK